MKSRHITKILDRVAFKRLSSEDSAEIGEHIRHCSNCRAAFHSARIASILLNEQTLAEHPLTPFFQAKVLKAWREDRFVATPCAAFWRWWQASATLVVLMFLTVAGLMTVSLIASNSKTSANDSNSETDLYSAETVILNQKTPRHLTTEQVFEVLYEGK